jgi:hypothetical protein
MNRFRQKIKISTFIITLSIIYCNTIYGGEPSISSGKILRHITYIASEETDGRLMGGSGNHKAGKYIEDAFLEYGIVPADKYSGYSQTFDINVRHLSSDNYLSIKNKIFEQKLNFIPLYFSGEGEVSGVTCLVKNGLEIGDFKGCKGKIAVVLDGEWENKELKNELLIKKAKLAQEGGAKGLIIITNSVDAIYNDLTTFPEFIPPAYQKRWQTQHPSITDTLIEIKTTSITARQKIPSINMPVVMAIIDEEKSIEGLSVNIKIKFNDRTITGKNIVGLIKGKSDEVIIIGAHYDHLGRDGDENIFYGADDNGSGVAALLEIASAFSKIKGGLKRSVLFIAFDGEEWGLQGATAYVNNPAFPYEKTIAMLNMDTIGRNKADEIYIIGSLRSPDLKKLNDRVNSDIGLKLLDTIEFAFDYGSDHYPFYEKGIPSIDYTSSYHEDFHKITDRVEKVNAEKVSRVAELLFKVAYNIASANIRFDKPKKVYVPFPKK